MPRVTALPLLALVIATGCSSPSTGTIQILTTDSSTFAGVVRVTVSALDSTGDPASTLATIPWPTTTIDLGLQPDTNVDSIEVIGTDAKGVEQVYGLTLPISYGALGGETVPIFVQRLGHFAALPGAPLSDSRGAPVAAAFEGQYLFVGGGDASLAETSQIYDFAQFAPLTSPPSLPRAPLSIAFVGTLAWLIDGSGSATYFDFSSSASQDVPPLAGGSFADVAGGATVIANDGTEYIVGATRTTTPTSTVLEINPSDTSNPTYPYGNMTWLTLTEPRLGASATWVSGYGLVIAGGSSKASGVEVFALPTSSVSDLLPLRATTLPYPPDPSVGAGATILSSTTVLLAGGVTPAAQDAGVRTIDLGCMAGCVPALWKSLPMAITSSEAFGIDSTSALVVGNEPVSGTTHAFLLSATTATEVPMAKAHKNATATVSPLGSIVVVGGAGDIESFVPSL